MTQSETKKEKNAFVYLASRSDGYLKVGISSSPSARIKSFGDKRVHRENRPEVAGGVSVEVHLLRTAVGGFAAEGEIQQVLRQYAVDGCKEWFHDTEESRRAADDAMAALGPDMRHGEDSLVFVGLRLAKDLWRSIRVEAANREISAQQLVTEIVQGFFQKRKGS
jgi:hypothetical protein